MKDVTSGFELLHPSVQHHIVNTLRWPGLRPLQAEAAQPVSAGQDALLLAPTAGGKTEAAIFPLLTRMAAENWAGVSVLYLCPLKALLNNLEPRVAEYCAWTGRSAAVWHGDVETSRRRVIQLERPDVLLTTPESLEAMLVSEHVDAATFLGGLQAVVIDEIHSFAGDDRGWHLLAVVARLEHMLHRPLQRIGMSATVGNPVQLSWWLLGSPGRAPRRPLAVVVSPGLSGLAPVAVPVPAEVTVDFVGSMDNAATLLSQLYRGEKRLVFVDSRRRAEELSAALRSRDVITYISHSSLSAEQRRESEAAFAEGRDCVIVSTSTLELGIDVGDLDRVIQIDSPRTVSSLLQRLGRTGRRTGSVRNCLFLCLTDESFLLALSVLLRWSQGWVELVEPPILPRHIAAQQILAAALASHGFALAGWRAHWGELPLMDDSSEEILAYLLSNEFLESDSGVAFIGPQAERHFGRRHFLELLATFTAAPQFTVVSGRREIGSVGVEVLLDDTDGPRVLLLAGRSWKVTHLDWKRRRCYVAEVAGGGKAKWSAFPESLSFDLARGMRDVVLGGLPTGISLTRRAMDKLIEVRADLSGAVDPARLVLQRIKGEWRLWTWAGMGANRTLAAWVPELADQSQKVSDLGLRLHGGLTVDEIQRGLARARSQEKKPLPTVPLDALRGLKFSAALPNDLARQTLANRMADVNGALSTLLMRSVTCAEQTP